MNSFYCALLLLFNESSERSNLTMHIHFYTTSPLSGVLAVGIWAN